MSNRNLPTICRICSTPPVVANLEFGNEEAKIRGNLDRFLAPKFGCVGIQVHDNDWPTHYRSDVEPTKYFCALINGHANSCCRRAAACRRCQTAPTSRFAPARAISYPTKIVAGRRH